MTTQYRLALAALLLAAPVAAQAQHTHAARTAGAPAAAPQVAPAPPAPPAEDEFAGAADDEALWFDDADLLAFGLDDDFFLGPSDEADAPEPGDGPDGPMAMGEDDGGAPAGHVMHLAPGAGPMGGMGLDSGAGMHPGMGMGAGMHGGMGAGMHGRMAPDAPGGRGMMRRHMRMGMGMRLAGLDLTDAQREKLRDLHEAHARKAVQRRADLQLAQMDLRKMLRADKPAAPAINAQIDKIAKLRADGMKSAIETRLQAREVLTPEQRKQLHPPMGAGPMMHQRMMDKPEGGKN